MNRVTHLANRFSEIIFNGTWIANTNYKQELSAIRYEDATIQYGNLNTIAALSQHIHYYIKGILQVLQGGELAIRDKYSFDFPAMNSSEQWTLFLAQFWSDAALFICCIEAMEENDLDKIFVDEKYGNYQRNIEAMIEHAYYHLGQIVLLRKILSTTELLQK